MMTAAQVRDYDIAIRTTEILAQRLSRDWVPVQNWAHDQAAKEWDAAHKDDSWEKINTRITEAIK